MDPGNRSLIEFEKKYSSLRKSFIRSSGDFLTFGLGVKIWVSFLKLTSKTLVFMLKIF